VLDVQQFYDTHPVHVMMSGLIGGAFDRGLPEDTDLAGEPAVVDFFRALLKADGGIEVPASREHEDKAISTCHQNGWIHADIDRSGIVPVIRYTFPSPLHQAHLSWRLQPLELDMIYDTPLDMVRAVISRFKYANVSPHRGVNPNEAAYRLEFYRCLHELTGGSVRISPEFASSQYAEVATRIDLFIPQSKWGIELTHDGRKLGERNAYFLVSGAYEKWMKMDDMDQCILLDFRTSLPSHCYRSK
jgi:hypothetical protein